MNKIGIIGGGNMGAALIKGLVGDYSVCVTEKDQRRASFLRRRFGIATLPLKTLVQKSQILVLAVKPQQLDQVVQELSPLTRSDHLIISIVAGMMTSYIEKGLGGKVRVIRTMPNLPLQIGQGITAICKGRYARKSDVDTASRLFNHVGTSLIVSEKDMDAVTAISGSGPAYVFLFTEYLFKAARGMGLSERVSRHLIQKTLSGSLALMERSKESPSVLRARVTSKGGTTQAALKIFSKRQTEKIFKEALTAAKKRSRQLAKK